MNAPAQKSRLGRGLASLIGEPAMENGVPLPIEGEQRVVSIDQLHPSVFNPRKDFPEADLVELADSIRVKGLVQPPLVRKHPKVAGAFEIVAGERRWRAAQRAGLHQVPVIVRELDDQSVLELAIIENVQRSDLNAIEEAGGYADLMDRFDYSQEQLSEIIGKSRSHVANTLRLLKLPSEIQSFVQSGELSAGHARTLVGHRDAMALAKKMIAGDMSVREAEAMVQAALRGGGKSSGTTRPPREKDADTLAFEKEIADALGLKVEIKRGSGESGNLVIKYGNFDQLEYIRARLFGMGS
ncbi:MAG: ParB/RepB/Spo0J family partition protein [Hyphomicrobiaceae bacterium]